MVCLNLNDMLPPWPPYVREEKGTMQVKATKASLLFPPQPEWDPESVSFCLWFLILDSYAAPPMGQNTGSFQKPRCCKSPGHSPEFPDTHAHWPEISQKLTLRSQPSSQCLGTQNKQVLIQAWWLPCVLGVHARLSIAIPCMALPRIWGIKNNSQVALTLQVALWACCSCLVNIMLGRSGKAEREHIILKVPCRLSRSIKPLSCKWLSFHLPFSLSTIHSQPETLPLAQGTICWAAVASAAVQGSRWKPLANSVDDPPHSIVQPPWEREAYLHSAPPGHDLLRALLVSKLEPEFLPRGLFGPKPLFPKKKAVMCPVPGVLADF